MQTTIKQFCDKYDACREGREWALSTGCTTMNELWQREDIRPEWRIWIATRHGVLSRRTLRLFACFCARQVCHLMKDERSRHAVDVAESYAEGKATDQELQAARVAAWAAAWSEASETAWAAVWAAAREAAWAAAWSEASETAWAAVWAAAGEAAQAAVWAAAGEAAQAAVWAAAGEAAQAAVWAAAGESAQAAAGAVSVKVTYTAKVAQADWLTENSHPYFD